MGKVTNKKVLVDKTNTNTSKPSTSTNTSKPSTSTNTRPSTSTNTSKPSTSTNTSKLSTSTNKNENTSTDDEFEEPKLFHELKSPSTQKAKKRASASDKAVKVVPKSNIKKDIISAENDSESDTDDDFEEVESFHTKPKTKLKQVPKHENEKSSANKEKSKSTKNSMERFNYTLKTKPTSKDEPPASKDVLLASKNVPSAQSKTTKLNENNQKRKATTKRSLSPNHKDSSSKMPLPQIEISPKESNISSKKRHLLDVLSGVQSGRVSRDRVSSSALPPILEQVSKFQVYKCVTPFDRRVTALDWHPTHPNVLTVGSKGGDLILWNYECSNNNDSTGRDSFKAMIKGRGPGGSIQALKFDKNNDHRVYTASIDGKIALRDFDGNQFSKVLLEFDMAAHNWNRWYTGLDVSFSGKVIVAGDNAGWVTLLTMDGQEVAKKRLHKDKCNFVQFSGRETWMMVTTSTDHTAKIWDIRKLAGPESVLATLKHDKAVNSAFFSPVHGDKLLTTDQHSQLRVYQGPWFDRGVTIPHPHRQFQHLTPIKAVWHPLADIPVAGRYPDPAFPGYEKGEKRSIDLFNPETGERVVELFQPGMEKIISLSQFSPAGDALLSGMGQSVLVWKKKPDWEVKYDESLSNLEGVRVEQWPGLRQGKKRKLLKQKRLKPVTKKTLQY